MEKSTRRRRDAQKRASFPHPELYRSAAWQRAQIKAGRTQEESASTAGCAVPTLTRWRAFLNLAGKNGAPSRVSARARKTYANRRWLTALVEIGMSAKVIAISARITPVVARIWMRRLGITPPDRYDTELARQTLLKRRWLATRIERSDVAISDEVNRYAQQDGLYWHYSQWDIARARKQFKLPTQKNARRLRLHRQFALFLTRHQTTLRRLRPGQQQILRLWYLCRTPRNGVKIAARLHCSRANVHIQRVRAIARFHALRKIPKRFWPLFHPRATLKR